MRLAVTVVLAFCLSGCAAYQAQHHGVDENTTREEAAAKKLVADRELMKRFEAQSLAMKQATLISALDQYTADLASNGKYDCCVKPGCRQCIIREGECHCRKVIDANGPCCGECTQAWIEGKGNTAGIDREKVLEHLGCVRELYEKKAGAAPAADADANDDGDDADDDADNAAKPAAAPAPAPGTMVMPAAAQSQMPADMHDQKPAAASDAAAKSDDDDDDGDDEDAPAAPAPQPPPPAHHH
jgi:hypothetical protein